VGIQILIESDRNRISEKTASLSYNGATYYTFTGQTNNIQAGSMFSFKIYHQNDGSLSCRVYNNVRQIEDNENVKK